MQDIGKLALSLVDGGWMRRDDGDDGQTVREHPVLAGYKTHYEYKKEQLKGRIMSLVNALSQPGLSEAQRQSIMYNDGD